MNTPATTHQKSLLLNLPTELLDATASFITDPAVLSKLSQTCRELYHIAKPVLWRAFIKADGTPRKADDGLKSFFESIHKNAELGKFVCTLKVKSMRCSSMYIDEDDHGLDSIFKVLPPKSLNIETLFFRNSGLGESALSALLTACNKLKSFGYERGDDNGAHDEFHWKELVGEMQRLHGTTIERIGYQHLSLEDDDFLDIRDQLRELEKDVSVRFPRLKEIGVWIEDTDLAGFDEVIESYAAKGVKVTVNWSPWCSWLD